MMYIRQTIRKEDFLMKRTNIYLSTKQLEALTKLSEKIDLSVAETVRRAVDDYLRKNK
jgi:ribbon-helix-helix protein